MKTLLLLVTLASLCVAPFWKTEYERRWEDAHAGKAKESTDITSYPPCGGVMEKGYTSKNGIDGKALFKTNCAVCHFASDKRSTGPGLKGVLDRIPEGDWKYNWIHNSSRVIASGDAYAVNRFNEFNKTSMTPFPGLKNEEIDAILDYCQTR